jgi:hypothetical protein
MEGYELSLDTSGTTGYLNRAAIEMHLKNSYWDNARKAHAEESRKGSGVSKGNLKKELFRCLVTFLKL